MGNPETRFREEFQSTLPVGGATIFAQLIDIILVISIHAPRGGSDIYIAAIFTEVVLFQSTLPVGGATEKT